MEFDPVGSAQSIPHMIKNDTLIEVLDQDQLSECLKHIVLNVDDSLYILDKVQSKYKVSDRFKAVRHIFTDFGEDSNFDNNKFIEFIRSLGRCLHLDILDSIASIIESMFSKNDLPSAEIEQFSQKATTEAKSQPHLISTSETKIQLTNKNIEELMQIEKTDENFDKIYEICNRIAAEKDKDAMSFAVREKYVYIIGSGKRSKNIFTQAAHENNQGMIRLMIESGIDINSGDRYIDTALIWASLKGHYELVKLLLSVPGIDVNAKNICQKTAIYYASEFRHHDVVKLLKDHGAID